MGERIAFTAWDFVSLCCYEHKEELLLEAVNGKPFYSCPVDSCDFSIPALVYEKILDETVKKINEGKLIVGARWRKKYCGKNYECTINAAPVGKKPVITIRIATG